jgi:hypothetical protein
MTAVDVRGEIETLLPDENLGDVALLKRGIRADTYTARLRDSPVLAKRFHTLDDHAKNECESYRLFTQLTLDVAPKARLIAADNRWVIVDAVDGRDFFAALAAGDAPVSLMDRLGRTLVSLLAATVDPAGGAHIRSTEADKLTESWPEVIRWSERLGAVAPKGLDEVVAAIVDRYRHPPVVAWTQGDPAPSNVLFNETAARLVDFEYAGYRHALHDLVQWWVRIPLRYDWCARLEQVVGNGLIERRVYPSLEAFDEDHVAMAAYAALYMFTWLPIERALEEELSWAPGFDARCALLSTSNRLAARVRSTWPALATWSERVFTALSRRWPERKVGAVRW